MTDPFVQKMMAKSQARRAAVAQILGNKENVGLSNTTRSRLKDLSSLHSDGIREATTPLQPSNDGLNPIGNTSPVRKTTVSLSSHLTVHPVDREPPQPTLPSENRGPSSPTKSRLTSLARRCQEINNWDDDYTYHSSSHGSQVAVEGNLPSTPNDVHGSSPSASSLDSVVALPPVISNNPPSPCYISSAASENATPTYHLGEEPTGRGLARGDEYTSSSSGAQSSISKASSSAPDPPVHPSYQLKPQTPSKTVLSQNVPASPTKKLLWDQGMLSSLVNLNDGLQDVLEAQGFTPSDSRSKLSYDFKKEQQKHSNGRGVHESPVRAPESPVRAPKSPVQAPEVPPVPASPSKVRGLSLAELIRSSSPQKKSSPTESANPTSACLPVAQPPNNSMIPPPPPPVVVSCLPKSPVSSPTRQLARVSSPEPKVAKDRARDTSPSKVGEMRSRWEQHIRQASPERSDRSRSPRKPESPKKMPSVPSGRQINQPTSGSIEPATSQPSCSPQSPHKYNQSGFNRSASDRKSWRELSPHKPGPAAEVVKGQAPMPQAVPLVQEPFSSSVRERAAAFDGARGREPEKDPAEMSVQERLAIFSKKQSGALIPKAPFGQPVPAKALHGDAASAHHAAPSRPSVAHSQPVHRPHKRMAAEPSSVHNHNKQEMWKNNRSTSPAKNVGLDFGDQRKTFENLHDNWRENDINAKVQCERKQEMEVLLNRFKKPRPAAAPHTAQSIPKYQAMDERPRYPEESESEYLESDESIGDSSTSEDVSQDNMQGPPKPPRLFIEPHPKAPQPQDLFKQRQLSPPSRLNSTEIGEVCPSPKKVFVPKMKPGCLYPSLSDVESHSEAPDSQDEDVKDSSFAESVLTCASMESLGQKIKRTANTDTRKPLSMIAEGSTFSQTDVNNGMSESTMEALDAIDDALDEAIEDDLSPTPPKRHCSQNDVHQSVYKTPKINNESPSHNVEEQDTSLAHSISMYRKQKPEVVYTPVRQIIRRPDLDSPSLEPVSPSVTVSARIKELQEEVLEQQRVIGQASNAVSVVLQRPEQQGTPQHVEAEKLLLLSSQKRQSALNEIQRLKAEGALRQQSWTGDEDCCMGSISISNISVPLKHEFLQRGMKGEDLYHLMVLVKHREQVISSQLLTTPECVVEGAVTFPNLMALHHLTSDFNITLEVYALCTQEPRQSNLKKEHSRMKLTPLKRLQKHESRMASPSVQSPAGPFAVRTSAFQLVGFTHLNISTLPRNAWTLEKVPFSSPLDGHLLMHVSCSFEGGITERGFLTMFEDVGGFGAWNRRWCVLNGMYLRYWRYPDDENRKEATGQLDLRSCITRRVELVSRDICARQHTFQLTLLRPAHPRDATNLVQEVKGTSVITKMLLSSDSKEERLVWCSKLNKSLANIRAWDPDALRPKDYQV